MIRARTASADDTRDLGAALAGVLQGGDVVALVGDLGAGKTALTQGLGRGLGVEGPVTSPTFALVHDHPGRRLRLLHADVYRLDDVAEVVDLGLTELVDPEGDGGAVAVVEWGDKAAPALPPDALWAWLDFGDGEDERRVTLDAAGGAWAARQDDLRRALGRWLEAGAPEGADAAHEGPGTAVPAGGVSSGDRPAVAAGP